MSQSKENIPWLTKFFFGIFALFLLAATVVAVLWYDALIEPGPLIDTKTVVIPKGAKIQLIGERLEKAGIIRSTGVIRSKWVFVSAVRLQEVHREMRAGEYKFWPGISIRHVISLLRKGQIVNRRVTITEGMTVPQIIATLGAAEGLEGVVFPTPKEGRLLPDTYYYAFGDSRQTIVDRMALQMQRTLDALWLKRAPNLPIKTKQEAVILASIVEKETGLDSERRLVAGVFINRLKKGIRLESDPTVVYAINGANGPLGRGLRKSELRKDHPYNTYRIAALPPGPICNPGRASIEAVLNPEKTQAIFFVADGTGGHKFSTTLQEHRKAVRKWRAIERKRKRLRNEAP
ncbi:MAG: endolytic transglycosylase MltG [Proteobacteria bacterium]|nr:endolytic transglycosylase MltG [Pseudomonadota bacterium]